MSNSGRLPHITSQTFESAKQMTFSSLAAWQTDCFSLLTLHPNHAHCPLHIVHCPLPIALFLLPIALYPCTLPCFHRPLRAFGQWNFLPCTQSQKGYVQFVPFGSFFYGICNTFCLLDVQWLFNLILASWHNWWTCGLHTPFHHFHHSNIFHNFHHDHLKYDQHRDHKYG